MNMSNAPKIKDAPGITWRKLKHGWECRWRARSDLVARGWVPTYVRLFAPCPESPFPDPVQELDIAERANALQDEMLLWGHGGVQRVAHYDGTWGSLADCYRTDRDSPYQKARFNTRENYNSLCRKIKKTCGGDKVTDTDARAVLRLYDKWSADGTKLAMGHACIGMMRALLTFGATLLKDKKDRQECRELKVELHDMRFKNIKPRQERLTAEMADAIRRMAPAIKRRSIALAQAFQFECTLRQKDVIGEWVPLDEKGPPTDIIARNEKWWRGVRWEEIDKNLILRHMTSKRQKEIEVDLTLAPMVLEELRFLAGLPPDAIVRRDHLPASGPVVICEHTGQPWRAHEFRRKWREVADACGIAKHIRNMDSRAGAITEATDAGAPIEHVRHAASHENTSMTERYSRGAADKTASVMKLRVESRGQNRDK